MKMSRICSLTGKGGREKRKRRRTITTRTRKKNYKKKRRRRRKEKREGKGEEEELLTFFFCHWGLFTMSLEHCPNKTGDTLGYFHVPFQTSDNRAHEGDY
jgi:hypothetical protein